MPRTKTKSRKKPITPQLVSKVLCLKALLILARIIPRTKIVYEHIFINVLEITDDEWRDIGTKEIIKLIKNKLKDYPLLDHDHILTPYHQLRELGKQLSLSTIEQIVLLIMVWFRQDTHWVHVLGSLDTHGISRRELFVFLSELIGASEKSIATTLSTGGTLARSGLLKHDGHNRASVGTLFNVMEGLNEYVLENKDDWISLINTLYFTPARNKLGLKDFDYLSKLLVPAQQLLEGALSQKTAGIHILLYGPPGTGKTELAWALGNHLNAKLLSVNTKDIEGKETDGLTRFRSYLLGQRLFQGEESTLFIFDELEDVFPAHPGVFFRDSSAFYKGYINGVLESTSLPTIWTANNLDWMDRSHLRRFSYILEVPIPPRSAKRHLLNNALAEKAISDPWIGRVSESETLTPAEIAQLGSVVDITNVRGKDAEILMETILAEKINAMGHKSLQRYNTTNQIKYDLNYLNLDTHPESLLTGLKRSQMASLLFYGLPGTGKSALAKHLSLELDTPIIMKRASELLSMWVGGTEKNISKAFRDAEREKAILFLDEADSFLRSRETATRSWEVTEVNEMLVQMENFEGIFIAATNLIDNLDMAAFRRFDFKIRFDCLSSDQRWNMFQSLLEDKPEDLSGCRAEYAKKLGQLGGLAPGDFRSAIRNLKIRQQPVTMDALFSALQEECKFKNLHSLNKGPLGFTAN
jgi:SpoVK/Ycf46/Vps4 family AAA+-type ATPase